MIEIVYKENKEQANGNEGYFHLPKNIRQVGDTNGRERIYLEDYVGTFLKKYFFIFPEFPCGEGRCSFGMPPGHGQREKARRDIFIYIIFVLLHLKIADFFCLCRT